MTTRTEEPASVAAASANGYTDPHHLGPMGREADRPRRGSMLGRKSEETEWTRFSKALSPRDREEAEAATVEEEPPAPPPPPSSPATRQAPSDLSVAARTVTRPTSDAGEEVESTIGEHTSVDGNFRSENSIRIRGTVQGEIESRRTILVEEQANVNAKVTAASVTIAGQVNGQIYCSGRVEIRPSGRVIGEINAGTLIMQEGAFFEGNLKMGSRGATVAAEQPAPEPTPRPVSPKG